MSGETLQLHATLDDLRDLVIRWAAEQTVVVSAREQTSAWVPFDSVAALGSLAHVPGASTQVALARNRAAEGDDPDLHGSLVIHVGSLTEEALRESAIGVVGEGSEDLELWRGLIAQARSQAHLGATVVNPVTEAQLHLPNHPHLRGAHELASQGVEMLAAAGWNPYEFDDLG